VASGAEIIVKRLESWKTLVAIAVALLAAGGAAWSVAASKADVVELHQVRDVAAAQLSSAQAGTSAQLGALQTQVQDLRVRQAAVESKLDILVDMSQRLLDQGREVAKATGAKQLPDPAATSSLPTRPP
jgi:hypothetical protein